MPENYEIVCEQCSKIFESTDEEATLCPECWEKAISLENEGRGEE